MLRFLLVAVVVAVTFLAMRRAKAAPAGPLTRRLGLFAAAAALNHALVQAWRIEALAATRPLLVAAAAAAGLAAWWAIARLIHDAPRRRDPWFRWPLFGIATITAVAGAPFGVAAGFTIAGSLCWRWKDRYATGALFRLGFAAIALAALLLWQLPWPAPELDAGTPIGALGHFAEWARFVALFYCLFGVVALFAGFVRDPSLGIRTVGRRLAVSHLLVVLVPIGLTLALWAVTTVVGIGAERARMASAALAREAAGMERALRAGLEAGGPGDRALLSVASAWSDSFPGTRLWIVRGDAARLAHGPAAAGDTAVAAWFAASDSVPTRGLAGFGARTWLAARVRGGGDAGAVLAVPVSELTDGYVSRLTGARVWLSGSSEPEELVRLAQELERATADSASGPAARAARDSIAALRDSLVDQLTRSLADGTPVRTGVRRAPRNGPAVRFTAGDDTLTAIGDPAGDGRDGLVVMPTGSTSIVGARWRGGEWRRREFILTVNLGPGDILLEMVRRAGRGDIDVVPLALVGVFAFLFALVAAFDLVMVVNMGRSITAAIGALREGARRLRSGDLAHRIAVAGRDDLWDVARAFNEASEGLEAAREMEKERDRLESELALARRIQSRLLPSAPPDVPGWDIAGRGEPAREVGGDYYDHIALGGGRLVLVIADVSGKGVPASLLMSAFRAALVSQDLAAAEPVAVAGRLNDFLHASVEPGRFVTAFVAFLDAPSGRVVYVNAGHNPPLLLRAGGTHEWLTEGGTILGMLPATAFVSGEARLEPGDLLALYTDGVTEGADAAGEMWGEERLLEATRRRAALPAPRIVSETVEEVREFEGATGPADDITLLVAKRLAI